MQKNKLLLILAVSNFGLGGCALMGSKPSSQINIEPNDRVFLKIAPFDSTVQSELKRVGLDPAKIYDNLSAELHYQLFLKNQEESPDSAGATVRLTVSLQHIQPGTGNSGDFIKGTLAAERNEIQKTDLELRRPSKENAPVEFLPMHLPRTLAKEILSLMKKKPPVNNNDLGYPPPLILLH